MPKTRTWYDFQAVFVKDISWRLSERYLHIGLFGPTGCGKTMMAAYLAGQALQHGYTHVVIVTTLSNTSEGFEGYSKDELSDGGEFPEIFYPKSDATDRLIKYLDANSNERAIVAHYSVWGAAVETTKRRCFRGCLFILDEGQHTHTDESSDNNWSITRNTCVDRGGSELLLSATPYRHDQRQVYLDGSQAPLYLNVANLIEYRDQPPERDRWVAYIRSVSEQMVAKLAPQYFENTFEEVCGCENVQPKATARLYAKKIRDVWEEDGRPAMIIHLLGPDGIESIHQAFSDVHDLVLDITGDEGKIALSEALGRANPKDGPRAHWDDLPKIIIAQKRGDEATDIPWVSHTVHWTVSESIPLTIQRIGRATRSKMDPLTGEPLYPGYPTRWLDTFKAVFLTPHPLNSTAFSRDSLNLNYVLDSYRHPNLVISFLKHSASQSGKGKHEKNCIPEVLCGEYFRWVGEAVEWWRSHAHPWSVKLETDEGSVELLAQVTQWYAKQGGEDLDRDLLKQVIRSRRKDWTTREFSDSNPAPLTITDPVLVQQYRDSTLVKEGEHRVDGSRMSFWAFHVKRVQDNLESNLTYENLLLGLPAFRELHKRNPNPNKEDVDPQTGNSYVTFDGALKTGKYDFPLYVDGLPQLVIELYGTGENWTEVFRNVSDRMKEDAFDFKLYRDNNRDLSPDRAVIGYFGVEYPEVSYGWARSARKVLDWFPTLAERLTLHQANRLPGTKARLSQLLQDYGEDEVVRSLQEGRFPCPVVHSTPQVSEAAASGT
jgi:hypothetical protein